MKTLEQVRDSYKSETIDGRDLYRLAFFIPKEQLADFGLELGEGVEHEAIPYTRENILNQLEKDVEFGFNKALNKRGISASLMFDVVKMWNWILEEGLEDWSSENYAMYGLPLFKATAVKYGFRDHIPDQLGNESCFAEDDEEYGSFGPDELDVFDWDQSAS